MSNKKNTNHKLNRRQFVKLGTAGLGAALSTMNLSVCAGTRGRTSVAPEHPFVTKPMNKVRVGFVGVGGMGTAHVRNYLKIDKVELKAVCDIVPEKVERVQKMTMEAGQPKPTG